MDPIERFPSEGLEPILTSLPTSQLVLSNLISKRWSSQLKSNSSPLYRKIDLTNLKTPLSEEETINTVHRLLCISSHPKKELHIDLSPFWNRFQDKFRLTDYVGLRLEDIIETTSYKYITLISAIV